MDLYSLTSEDLLKNANNIKELLIESFLDNGLIDEKTAQEMLEYVVIVSKKGWFGKAFDKFFNFEKEDQVRMAVFRLGSGFVQSNDKNKGNIT